MCVVLWSKSYYATGRGNIRRKSAPCTEQIFLFHLFLGAIGSCTFARTSEIWFAALTDRPRPRKHNNKRTK